MRYLQAMILIWRNMVVGRSRRQKLALASLYFIAFLLISNASKLGWIYFLEGIFIFLFAFPAVVYIIDDNARKRLEERSRTN